MSAKRSPRCDPTAPERAGHVTVVPKLAASSMLLP